LVTEWSQAGSNTRSSMYQVGHASSGVVVETLYGVAVYVEGEGDGRMAKPIRHDLWVDACLQGQGGPGVAHVVEPDAWYCGPGDPAVEHLGNGFWVVVEAVRLGEKQVAVPIPLTHHQAFFELGPPMLAEQCASFRIEAHLATAPVGLEVGELRNMADDPQLPHQSEPPGFEVAVPPSQAENLAAPHPGHERNMPHDVEAVVASGIQERRNLAKWIDEAHVLYIGKADAGSASARGISVRLDEYLRFGQGEPIGHWGGRYLWQLAGTDQLLVCWKPCPDPSDEETRLLDLFRSEYGTLPFANLKGGSRLSRPAT